MIAMEDFEIGRFIRNPADAIADCKRMAEVSEYHGVWTVQSPFLPPGLDRSCQQLMADFYALPLDVKQKYAHPELHYQTGYMPENIEKARDILDEVFRDVPEEHKPGKLKGDRNPYERYFTPPPKDELPRNTRYPALSGQPQTIPAEFPEWENLINEWRVGMRRTMEIVLQMMAIGFSAERDLFLRKTENGPHMLSSTGCNIEKHQEEGETAAEGHADLNLISGHGRANLPGMEAWTRDLKRFPVSVPEGSVLCQPGLKFPILTGGRVLAGFHQVRILKRALDRAHKIKVETGAWPIRTSLNYFFTCDDNKYLEPIGPFRTEDSVKKFPRQQSGRHTMNELEAIGMAA